MTNYEWSITLLLIALLVLLSVFTITNRSITEAECVNLGRIEYLRHEL